jgi:hypothetical protein
MTDVYFGIWDDPDLGGAQDDLVGCDTLLTGGYTYNDGPDNEYGNNPPSFFVKSLTGPVTYIPGVTFIDNNGNGTYDEGIDTPLDTAYVHRGQVLGINEYPGAKNLELSSAIHYLNGDSYLRDPENKLEARNYILGLSRTGILPDPCTWIYGEVRGGVDCSQVNPMFWYSGDPASDYGWICIDPSDQRQMQNIGPFNLEAGKEVEIFVAYTVGQGADALTSITETKNIAGIAGVLYNSNFDTSSVVSVEEIHSGNIPEEFYLSQNYPNPFNPTTKIEFRIADFGFVTLKVYDILGNEIATLVNEEKAPGIYEVLFNAADMVSGVYIYSLKVGSFKQTKKMILMK